MWVVCFGAWLQGRQLREVWFDSEILFRSNALDQPGMTAGRFKPFVKLNGIWPTMFVTYAIHNRLPDPTPLFDEINTSTYQRYKFANIRENTAGRIRVSVTSAVFFGPWRACNL